MSNNMDQLISLLPSIFFFLLSITAFLLLVHLYRSKHRTASYPKSLKPYPLIGHIPHFFKNRDRFLQWITEEMVESPTNTVSFLMEPIATNGVITANPCNVEHILKTNFCKYPKGRETIACLRDFLGAGIFNSDGDQWLWQRKAASFEFSTRSLRCFIHQNVEDEIQSRLLPVLRRAAAAGVDVDLQEEFERSGFNNIFRISFGKVDAKETGLPPPEFGSAFREAQNLTMIRLLSPLEWMWRLKKLLNLGSEGRLKEAVHIVHSYAESLIRARKLQSVAKATAPAVAEACSNRDLMTRMASANPDMDETQLRDILISFIVAGRETTSSALTWFFWILSSRPDVERKILIEIRAIKSDIMSSTFGYDELQGMHYLHAAITESMRLYPPVPVDVMTCIEDDRMPDGTRVGKGWFVAYSSYAMGRMEDVWGRDCMEYRPERWLDGSGCFRPVSRPFSYPVFHGGPRSCLGKEMAYLQMKSIVACVLDQFEILAPGKDDEVPEHVMSFTLRMKGGLLVRVKERVHKRGEAEQ